MSLTNRLELRKGVIELALIFVGITLALAFENLNSERADREQELVLLTELLQDLDETQIDLERDIDGAERRSYVNEALLKWFNYESDPWPDIDSELSRLRFVCNLPGLFPKTSAYESIKSVGLDLISNDSVRSSTASLFELSLDRIRIRENNFRELSNDHCWPTLFGKFEVPLNTQLTEREVNVTPDRSFFISGLTPMAMTPIDPAQLRQDANAKQVFLSMHITNLNVLSGYIAANVEIDALSNLIKEEYEF